MSKKNFKSFRDYRVGMCFNMDKALREKAERIGYVYHQPGQFQICDFADFSVTTCPDKAAFAYFKESVIREDQQFPTQKSLREFSDKSNASARLAALAAQCRAPRVETASEHYSAPAEPCGCAKGYNSNGRPN